MTEQQIEQKAKELYPDNTLMSQIFPRRKGFIEGYTSAQQDHEAEMIDLLNFVLSDYPDRLEKERWKLTLVAKDGKGETKNYFNVQILLNDFKNRNNG